MVRTKKNKEGQWVNDKAKSIVEEFIRRRADTHPVDDIQDVSSEQFVANDNAFYLDVVKKSKKGNVYGLGQLGDEFLASTQCSQSNPYPTFNYQEVIANLNAELA
ncbi:transposase, Ptta/En/Spm, plant [Spatholobus suberectus]|nr:transposase, Ptta/En/Spm, plant [Spatholobus suberectus]